MEIDKRKDLNTMKKKTIIILSVLVIIFAGYLVYAEFFKEEKREFTDYTIPAGITTHKYTINNESCLGDTLLEPEGLFGPENYMVHITDIQLDNKILEYKYISDYEKNLEVEYIGDEIIDETDNFEYILGNVCVYQDYLIVLETYSSFAPVGKIIDKNGKIKHEFAGYFKYEDGILSIEEIFYNYEEDNSYDGSYKSYSLDLRKSWLRETDVIEENFDCDDYDVEKDYSNESQKDQSISGACNALYYGID